MKATPSSKIDRSAREKMVRARTNLLVSNGFFGFLALQLRLVEATEGNPTMAVDGISLFYNPQFVHSLTERQVEGVAAHEVMHCCFKHFSRRGNRDPMIWNIAGDYVINADLLTSGFELPGQPISKTMLMDPNCKAKGYMFDPCFKNMNTETVYDILYQALTKMPNSGAGGDKNDPGGCGAVIDAPGDAGKQADVEQGWDTAVRTAVAVAKANNAGQIPGSLKSLISDLHRPKVSWRELTRRFIDQSMTKDTSWSRISRRSAALGTLLPGLVADRLRHLVFFDDISGSISHELAREMISEVAGALDEGTADMITVAYADTQVQHVDTYIQGDRVVCGHYTGGGTDFRDSFQWLKDNVPDASCVIYLTDLQVCDFGEEPPCPVLWAVYSPEHYIDHLAARAPFGQVVHVSNTVG